MNIFLLSYFNLAKFTRLQDEPLKLLCQKKKKNASKYLLYNTLTREQKQKKLKVSHFKTAVYVKIIFVK